MTAHKARITTLAGFNIEATFEDGNIYAEVSINGLPADAIHLDGITLEPHAGALRRHLRAWLHNLGHDSLPDLFASAGGDIKLNA